MSEVEERRKKKKESLAGIDLIYALATVRTDPPARSARLFTNVIDRMLLRYHAAKA